MNCPNCDHPHSLLRHALSALSQGYVCRGCGTWLYCDAADFRKKIARADVGLAVVVVGFSLFAAATRLETSIVSVLLTAFILGHLLSVASLLRRCKLVAGTFAASPRRHSYSVLGFGLIVIFFVWPYSMENATSTQIQSLSDWQVGILYITPSYCASVGSALLFFWSLCLLLTEIPDLYYTLRSSKISVANND